MSDDTNLHETARDFLILTDVSADSRGSGYGGGRHLGQEGQGGEGLELELVSGELALDVSLELGDTEGVGGHALGELGVVLLEALQCTRP